MNYRKKYVIDKKFQLKTAFGFIGITTLLAVIIVAVISATIFYNNNRIHNIIKTEDNIFQAFAAISSQDRKSPSKTETISNMSKDHYNNFQTTDKIIHTNKILLLCLLIFIILQGIILYILIIRKTHKISGPIYVMSTYFKEMIQGKSPNPRPLRKNDELTEFYDLFVQMVASLKKKGKK